MGCGTSAPDDGARQHSVYSDCATTASDASTTLLHERLARHCRRNSGGVPAAEPSAASCMRAFEHVVNRAKRHSINDDPDQFSAENAASVASYVRAFNERGMATVVPWLRELPATEQQHPDAEATDAPKLISSSGDYIARDPPDEAAVDDQQHPFAVAENDTQ